MSRKKKEIITSLTFSNFNEDDSGELIQLIAPEDEESFGAESFPEDLPILPIRNTVLFPGVVIPITVGRQKSIRLVKNSYRGDRIIGVIAQKNDKTEEPGFDDLFQVGTVARIIKMLVLPDGNTTIIIQGKQRFQLKERIKEDPYLTARVKYLEDKFPEKSKKETKAILQ
jgi:ATP-dependent Lon protease